MLTPADSTTKHGWPWGWRMLNLLASLGRHRNRAAASAFNRVTSPQVYSRSSVPLPHSFSSAWAGSGMHWVSPTDHRLPPMHPPQSPRRDGGCCRATQLTEGLLNSATSAHHQGLVVTGPPCQVRCPNPNLSIGSSGEWLLATGIEALSRIPISRVSRWWVSCSWMRLSSSLSGVPHRWPTVAPAGGIRFGVVVSPIPVSPTYIPRYYPSTIKASDRSFSA